MYLPTALAAQVMKANGGRIPRDVHHPAKYAYVVCKDCRQRPAGDKGRCPECRKFAVGMAKKRKVRILNAASETGDYTSPGRALTLVAQGRAVPVDAWTIRMLEVSEQHRSAVSSASGEGGSDTRRIHSPNQAIVARHGESFTGQTFLPYPQPGSFDKEA